MNKLIIITLFTSFLIACGANKRETSRIKNIDVSDNAKIALADKNSQEKVICTQEKRLGSNRITTVCRSRSELDATRKATQTHLRGTNHRSGPSTSESGGR